MSDDSPHNYFTAGEVAALAKTHAIADVPTTKSGMIKWIKRHEADYVNCFSRKRQGQKGGGGTECNWAFFSHRMYDILDAEIERRNALAPYEPPALPMERQRRYRRLREQPVDLSAPKGQWADALAAAAGLEGQSLTFRLFDIRKADRCLVRFDNKKYFSRELAEVQGDEVCITGTDTAPDLLWVLEYQRPRYSGPGPGRLICVADARLGKARYISVEFQQAAEAKRAAAAERRRKERQE